MKKLVFSKEKFIEVEGIKQYEKNICRFWVDLCDGVTLKDCTDLGFIILPEWCIEVDDDKPKTKKKKVFSKEKWYQDMIINGIQYSKVELENHLIWVNQCDGKTLEEIEFKIAYDEEWLVEVDE